ncbi:M23 family metallopeptidase [Rubrivirga sp. S365]|uniref:M23 family metallopeptidase n=1 Tax=Rubrivirga litoralis TaxID=3075598 RepID=A0ABU3BS72_9BACT|nr:MULTISPECIES: M23 family metallopeptidase [unclassified Rubrivirga]MDT0632143.1 M23 family metallopeptidase [Rubrivirga sp. F394]MDT7857035.1 M23 family metallopeptidase [Rubrivirga sp. S365]
MPVRPAALLVLLLALAACQSDRAPREAADRPAHRTALSGAGADEAGADAGGAGGLDLALPTSNRALLDGRPEDFYMGVSVTIDSLRPAKWEGGQYGFVRDPVPTVFGFKTFRRVHEGLDIRPTGRDAEGNAVDTVRAIDAGRVVHVNTAGSSYGNYVVVEHTWSGSPVYSLYAHLAEPYVAVGDAVGRGGTLGKMGFTGRGLGRSRSHVHLEIALLLNRHFDRWFDQYIGTTNLQGLFFGTNLAGVPPAELYEALARDPDLTFPEYVRGLEEGYVVDLPGGAPLDLLSRYPWLGPDAAATPPDSVAAWRVAFTQEGVPIRVEVADESVPRPTVEGVSLRIWLGDRSTNRMLYRRGVSYEPARRGYSYFALLATTAEGAPAW